MNQGFDMSSLGRKPFGNRSILPDGKELIPSATFRQARVFLEEADAIILVVDVRTALTSPRYRTGAAPAPAATAFLGPDLR